MGNEEQIDLPDENIFGGPLSKLAPTPNRFRNRRIIKKSAVQPIVSTMTLGGDCKDDNSQPPSIILERNGDRITRIIVKCCCGRHAELECEEEEGEENGQVNAIPAATPTPAPAAPTPAAPVANQQVEEVKEEEKNDEPAQE